MICVTAHVQLEVAQLSNLNVIKLYDPCLSWLDYCTYTVVTYRTPQMGERGGNTNETEIILCNSTSAAAVNVATT